MESKLKRIVKKFVVTVRTGLVSLWLSVSDNNGEHNNGISCSIKRLLIFWAAFLDIAFWQGKEFFCCPKPSRPVLENTQPPIQGVLGFLPGNKFDQSPVFNAEIKRDLYFFSLCTPSCFGQGQLYFTLLCFILREYVVAQLVEALHYKPEGRGFDSRWCQ